MWVSDENTIMAEVATATEFGRSDTEITTAETTAIRTIADQLEAEISTLDIYEGAMTGMLYVEDETGFQRGEVTPNGLSVTQVESPDEELNGLVRIEPDPGETVTDAVDSLSFAGD